MSSLNEEDESQNENEQDPGEFYGVRDGTLFLIDTSPKMFDLNPDGQPFFVDCIEEYIYFLKQKLVWNRQDWMGLVLFATEKWDMDPEIKNILTLQKLSLININKLKEAEKIRDKTWKDYKKISSSNSYPLHDALWHAAQCFSSLKITMSARRVILYTCHDVSPLTDENEKHRIRAKAATYNDIGLRLYVVGIGEKWNFDLFYKDLEMLSRNINQEDYQKISYKDLVQQMKRPSKHMAKLPFIVGKDVKINVDISSVCVKSEYLKKMTMSSENNAPLVSYTYFRRKDADEEEEENEDEEENDDKKINMPISDTELRRTQEFGGDKIYFTLEEVKSLNRIYDLGIDIIDVKPLSCDPMYHMHAPYFVSCNKNCTKGEKLLFAGLLDKCEKKKVMMTCRVTMRQNLGTYLYNMIPVSMEGGFYLYRIPYEENVYDFADEAYQYIYDGQNKKPPINQEGVQLFKKLIKKTLVTYHPEQYPNPKLQVTLQNVETLALDLDARDPPEDKTLPMENLLKEKIGSLTPKIKELFEQEEVEPPQKKVKKPEKSKQSAIPDCDKDVIELIQCNELDKCKVSDLRIFCQDAGLSKAGLKVDLAYRLYTHYDSKGKKPKELKRYKTE
ncbi:hypothetical protein KPH14_006870 [Odynerus spinipes]|uniref:ATP-dependent DNA helicase 2 subunit 1 n=1 Tax=Odynerus spinipes TaxID=1348599 RepID=A0AAD9RRA8_9HYME|nr:hypothetical protein KPH14_006870 [Odynerus spinipes]